MPLIGSELPILGSVGTGLADAVKAFQMSGADWTDCFQVHLGFYPLKLLYMR